MVFVAMSFDPKFNARWSKILSPAASKVLIDNEVGHLHLIEMQPRLEDSQGLDM